MRWSLILLIAMLGGCNWICGKVAETAFEQASGVEIEKDGKKLTFKTPEGEVTVAQTGTQDGKGRMVITDGKGKKVVMESGDEKTKITTEEGVMEYGGDGQVPKNFPLPVIDGAKVLMSTHHKDKKNEVYSVSVHSSKPLPDVATYYAAELKTRGFVVSQNDVNSGQGGMTAISGSKGPVRVQITAIKNPAKPGTSVSLTWQKKR